MCKIIKETFLLTMTGLGSIMNAIKVRFTKERNKIKKGEQRGKNNQRSEDKINEQGERNSEWVDKNISPTSSIYVDKWITRFNCNNVFEIITDAKGEMIAAFSPRSTILFKGVTNDKLIGTTNQFEVNRHKKIITSNIKEMINIELIISEMKRTGMKMPIYDSAENRIKICSMTALVWNYITQTLRVMDVTTAAIITDKQQKQAAIIANKDVSRIPIGVYMDCNFFLGRTFTRVDCNEDTRFTIILRETKREVGDDESDGPGGDMIIKFLQEKKADTIKNLQQGRLFEVIIGNGKYQTG